jgi:hypothetical protein
MKHLLLLVTFTFLAATSFQQVVFYESFDGIAGPTAGGAGTYTFPAGWRLRNVDSRTPDAQVAYINEAWERREDFGQSVIDSCAFSTSYYSPAGAADDWMWTPLIGSLPANSVLSWRGRAMDPSYPDGYEVRIMTSAAGFPTGGTAVMGNQVTSSTLLYSTAAEASSWTTHSINLNAYAGQSVYIGFRNNSNDKYVLLIDDVKVQVVNNYDAQLTSVNAYEYKQVPKSQAVIPLGGTVKNVGQQTLTNVGLAATVLNSSNATVFGSSAFSVPTVAAGASVSFTLGNFIPPAPGTYTIEYYPFMTQGDQQTNNDTLRRTVVITDSVFARDDGIPIGQLGIGAGNGYMGTSFTLTTSVEARSVVASFTRGYAGRKYACVIWNTTVAGVPNSIIASTDTLLYPDDNALLDTLPIHSGYVLLSPGKYVVTAIEFDSTLAIAQTANIFTAGVNWTKWSTNPAWTNVETFGASFNKAFYLRVNLTVNNSSPVITSNGGGATAGISVAENNTAVTTVTATDADVASTVYYVLNGGADAAKFGINAATGALSFITPPDYENPADADANNTYVVVVRATDGARTDEQTITITITNVNEAPVITSGGGGATAGLSIAENIITITTLAANDQDAGTTLTYSLNGGADASKFSINSTTGALTFIAAPDFETPADADVNNTYIVIVRVSDGSLTDDQTITVTISNSNDNTPVITSNGGGSTASLSVLNPQQNVTIVTATDADGTLNPLSYSISGGADAADFTINASTGQLSFINPTDIHTPQDADLNNIYLVTVQVSDGTFTDNQAITVTVTGTMPVTLLRLRGWTTTSSNILEWTTVNEAGIDSYEIERSNDARSFIRAGILAAKQQTANDYHFADMQYQAVSFYRIKMKSRDGSSVYSQVIKLDRNSGIVSMKLYPNPVMNGSFALQLNNLPQHSYKAELFDAAGRRVMKQLIEHPGGTATIFMKLDPSIIKGVYLLAIRGEGLQFNERIIIE